MRTIIVILLSICVITALAQPGGGGGLNINSFYNSSFEKIKVSDSSFKVRLFALIDTSINSKITHEVLPANYQHLSHSYDIYQTNNEINMSNQRMLIAYRMDTMIIDFLGIMEENGAGVVGNIDSVVFQRGYFRYFMGRNLYSFFSGLTPYTRERLSHIFEKTDNQPFIAFSEDISASFLLESNLPSTYYLRRAAYYISEKNFEGALTDLSKSEKLRLKPKDYEEYLWLLSNIYEQQENLDEAISRLSDLIEIKSKREYWSFNEYNNYNVLEHIKECYRSRSKLFIKKEQFDKALVDFDSLVEISQYYFNYSNNSGYVLSFDSNNNLKENIERAMFKMTYLRDYKGAKYDLMAKIKSRPITHLNAPGYCDTYFVLGIAEYKEGDKESAFHHWFKAMELGYAQTSSDYAVVHFDSIIRLNQKSPENYLSRGIANYRRGPYLGWGDQTTQCFNRALIDIGKAEELGLKNFRINVYRAKVLTQLKKYNEALKEINIAISKKPLDPICYMTRYDIRTQLGQTKWGDKSDPDLEKYNDLAKTWKFENN